MDLIEEQRRIKILESYDILDTLPEQELDELTEIASTICGTPISLISLIDSKRQWFKSKIGLDIDETDREDSFCEHALHRPNEVLIVEDPLNDERFANNPFVLGAPNVRFYAGAPLQTPNGNVLGTLCIIDDKPRKITDKQIRALELLAKRVMDYLNMRKIMLDQEKSIESSAQRLKQLTDQAPGALYQLRMSPDGALSFDFISKGISKLHPTLIPKELKKNAELAYSVVYPEDIPQMMETMQYSRETLQPWKVTYRVNGHTGREEWHETIANPERLADGTTLWYGAFVNITEKKEHEKSLEEFLFNISHELRRPISNLLGLSHLAELSDMELLKECFKQVKASSQEMDSMVKNLNSVYSERQLNIVQKPKIAIKDVRNSAVA